MVLRLVNLYSGGSKTLSTCCSIQKKHYDGLNCQKNITIIAIDGFLSKLKVENSDLLGQDCSLSEP